MHQVLTALSTHDCSGLIHVMRSEFPLDPETNWRTRDSNAMCVLGQQLVERTHQGSHVWNELPVIIDQTQKRVWLSFTLDFGALAL